MIDMDNFIANFMEVYAYKMNLDQSEKKRCKYCRYYKTKLSAKEVEIIKEAPDYLTKWLEETEFSICKKASKMALKAIDWGKHQKGPIITAHNGHCRLFRVSILKIIKSFFRKGNR